MNTRREMIKAVMISLILSVLCFGQNSEYRTDHLTRARSLGNAFTGLADDIEAVYYNTAGLANLNYYGIQYVGGDGPGIGFAEMSKKDIIILIPAFHKIGIFAISYSQIYYYDYDHLIFDEHQTAENTKSVYRIHFARNIFESLSVGVNLNYYHTNTDINNDLTGEELYTDQTVDIGISTIYLMNPVSLPGVTVEPRFGLQLQNLFNTDLLMKDLDRSNLKQTNLRLGFSGTFSPHLPKILSFEPFKLITVVDVANYNNILNIQQWMLNYGFELSLLEILKIRFGKQITDKTEVYSYFDQKNISKRYRLFYYGYGLTLPINKIFSSSKRMELTVQLSTTKSAYKSLFGTLFSFDFLFQY